MKYYKCNFMLSFIGLMLSLSSNLAYAYPLSNQPHTPPFSLELGSLSSDNDYDIAKVFWLPDYQTSMNGRTESPDTPGGGDLPVGKKVCSTYGFQESYDNSKYLCETVKPIIGMTCYTNCKCKPTVIPGVGEECDITCGSACVKSKCKPAVSLTNPNDRCTETCKQTPSICTNKTCDSKCASGTSLTCTGAVSGNDGCGSNCKKCCDENCPSGTTETNPGGCGGSTQNGCKTKTCFYGYQACCDNSCNGYDDNVSSCGGQYRTYTNGCGKTCYKCKNCSCGSPYAGKYSEGLCPSNYPYKTSENPDDCGYYCLLCKDAQVYAMYSYRGCNMRTDAGRKVCYHRGRRTQYKYVRYDGATRIEDNGWGKEADYVPEYGVFGVDTSNCDWCNEHSDGNPYVFLTSWRYY